MQEIKNVALSKESIQNFLSFPGALAEAIESNKEVIHAMLASYHYESRGYVYGVMLDQSSVQFKDSYSGSFVIYYKLNYTLSCSDVKYDTADKMIFRFVVDVDKLLLTLWGEEIREREPDEF